MIRIFPAIAVILFTACSAAAGEAEAAAALVGTFTNRPGPGSLGTHSVVEELQVALEGDNYRLTATMNITNREDGMDRTSNTFWTWTGEGRLVRGRIQFTYEARFVGGGLESGRGSFRASKGKYVLELDGSKHTVRRKDI
jgi:hypothetical protein